MAALPMSTVEEFYAHAIAIEREAAERYAEFEAYFMARGQETLARLCNSLAVLERNHLGALLDTSRGMKLPAISPAAYRWLGSGAPEAAARELFYRVASERDLLEIALEAEERARRFFDWVAQRAPTEKVRAMAREMCREEAEHVRWVQAALDYLPAKPVDWDRVIGRSPGPALFRGFGEPLLASRRRR